jgi:hypothetical protein
MLPEAATGSGGVVWCPGDVIGHIGAPAPQRRGGPTVVSRLACNSNSAFSSAPSSTSGQT